MTVRRPLAVFVAGLAVVTAVALTVADDWTAGRVVLAAGLVAGLALGAYVGGCPGVEISAVGAVRWVVAGLAVWAVGALLPVALWEDDVALSPGVVLAVAALAVPWLWVCGRWGAGWQDGLDRPPTDGPLAVVDDPPGYRVVKRALDVVVALVGVVAMGVLLPVVVVGNLVGNRGPLFYRQERVGRHEDHFHMLKFRTMRVAPPDARPDADWTVDDLDPRITRFGRFLRVTHLDELPQVVNVLKGDISIVGPRPAPLRYAAELLAHLPGYEVRQSVLPGMTGWAQVKYGYAGDAEGAREKLQYDLWYAARRSVALDLRIIGRTLRTVAGIGIER